MASCSVHSSQKHRTTNLATSPRSVPSIPTQISRGKPTDCPDNLLRSGTFPKIVFCIQGLPCARVSGKIRSKESTLPEYRISRKGRSCWHQFSTHAANGQRRGHVYNSMFMAGTKGKNCQISLCTQQIGDNRYLANVQMIRGVCFP